jgi:DMSO/TMAO reductase YedYZ molybdopterin-dependent catalytic subunit
VAAGLLDLRGGGKDRAGEARISLNGLGANGDIGAVACCTPCDSQADAATPAGDKQGLSSQAHAISPVGAIDWLNSEPNGGKVNISALQWQCRGLQPPAEVTLVDFEKGFGLAKRIKGKLIDAKQQWAKEGRLLTGTPDPRQTQRLPPGQRRTESWPVLDLGIQPEIPLSLWRITIDGLVDSPVVLKWGELTDLPAIHSRSDIHCVTAWSRYDNAWDGVAASTLIGLVRVRPEARFVIFQSYDTYSTNVPLERFARPDVLLAWSWNGKPIEVVHGGPLRVVLPSLYFWKSAKWIKRIEFSATDKPGFWETRGYHNDGDPWREQRYG